MAAKKKGSRKRLSFGLWAPDNASLCVHASNSTLFDKVR
jgi:hypothetical protein